MLLAFASTLFFFLFNHAMYFDEVQAWQIARHSKGVFDLASHLRYEGHPMLWYLFLYLPSHLSKHLIWMQIVNYCIAIGTAAVIAFERRIALWVRPAILFSGAFFFYMGTVSRSYMLAGILLIVAARFFTAQTDHHWMGVVSLALAINTHVLAIPIALAIFLRLYCLKPDRLGGAGVCRWRLLRPIGILLAALAFCYFTVRPAPDIWTPQYDPMGSNLARFLVLGFGSIWRNFVYMPPAILIGRADAVLSQPSLVDPMLTLVLFLLAFMALPSRAARIFFLWAAVLWNGVVWATVHRPTGFHQTFLFVSYVIALTLRSEDDSDRLIVPRRISQLLLVFLLASEMLLCLDLTKRERSTSFSASSSIAEWIGRNGLSNHPLVFTPDTNAPAVLGYLGAESAYLPSCRCSGSFVVFRKGRDPYLQVHAKELDALQSEYGSYPVLVSLFPLSSDDLRSLKLNLAYRPSKRSWGGEDAMVYIRTGR